jgi:hypothetical protein
MSRERIEAINNVPINNLNDYYEFVETLVPNKTLQVKTNDGFYRVTTRPLINITELNETEIITTEEIIQVKLAKAKRAKEAAKKTKDKDEIQLQINQIEEELALNNQMADEEFSKYEQLIDDSKNLNVEAEMLAELDDIIETTPIVEISDAQKEIVEQKVLSSEVTQEIDANELLLSEIPTQNNNEENDFTADSNEESNEENNAVNESTEAELIDDNLESTQVSETADLNENTIDSNEQIVKESNDEIFLLNGS